MQTGDSQLRALAENIPTLCWLANADGYIVWYNRRWYDYTGTTPDEMEGWGWQSVHHPGELPRVLEHWQASIATGKPFEMVFPIKGRDGTFRSFLTRVEPSFDGETVAAWFGVNTDISDQLKAEGERAAEGATWKAIFDEMREGFFVGEALRDTEGRMHDFTIVQMNRAFEAGTGISIQNAVGRPARTVVPAIDDATMKAYARVVDTGRPVRVEIPAANDRWFEARARGAGPERFAVLFLDITDRKRAERATIESEARFRSLAQSMPNHVWTALPSGQLDWFNERVYAYSGADEGSLDGEGWGVLVHPDDAASARDLWVKALAEGVSYQADLRLRRYDGTYRWHIARAEPIRGDDGEIRMWIGSNTDMEDQKVAEGALAELAATLENRIEERSRELEHRGEQLRQSQKMEAVGQLTGGVAHDFNNLLQVITGNLHMLAKDVAGNERAERRLTNAMAGAVRGAKLASQLLAFSRRQPLEPKVLNIGRFLAGVEDMLRRAIGEAVEIETVISGGLWNTLADPTQVENAVLNLALNGRDAMEGRGKLTVEVGNALLDEDYARAHAEVTPGQYVMLAVTDTGAGMTPEVAAQVFEPFFSTKAEGQGTGLGLSMVHGFVKQSGGHVKIYSEVGHGTTIKLYLPRVDQAEDVLLVADSVPAAGGTETILIAEDDDEVRATVVEMLRELGYRVITAKNADAALNVIESGISVDLLFTDVVMPGSLRSPDLARKARERLPNIAVLFTSGYTQNAIVHGGRLDAGVELLAKPYTRDALARKGRQVLANQDQRGQALTTPDSAKGIPVEPRSGGRLTVLLVEDDVLVRAIASEYLQDLGHVTVEAGSAEDALSALQNAPIDILVTDLGLPGASGADFAVRAREIRPDIGVIFATGSHSAPSLPGEVKGAALLTKPYDREALALAIMTVQGSPSLTQQA